MFGFRKYDKEYRLIRACRSEHFGKAAELVDAVKYPDVIWKDQLTPLLAATTKTPFESGVESIEQNRRECSCIIEKLLAAGADPNVTGSDLVSPLMAAAAKGLVNSVQRLLEKGANVNAHDMDGKTPLMHAVAWEQMATAKLLIENGSDICASDDEGSTPLMAAIKAPIMHKTTEIKKEIIDLMLEHGADVNQKDHYGGTALIYAAEEILENEDLEDIAIVLLETGANPNVGEEAETPLYLAVDNFGSRLVRALLEKGANVIPEAVERAQEHSNPEIYHMLIGSEAKISKEKEETSQHTRVERADARVELADESSRGGKCPFCGSYIQVKFHSKHGMNPYTDEREYYEEGTQECYYCKKIVTFYRSL